MNRWNLLLTVVSSGDSGKGLGLYKVTGGSGGGVPSWLNSVALQEEKQGPQAHSVLPVSGHVMVWAALELRQQEDCHQMQTLTHGTEPWAK
jgi:hypothetical protein